MYVFLAAGIVLLLVIGQQTLLSVGKKRSTGSTTKKTAPIETGTNNPNNVDYDWLPKQTLASLSKFLNNLIQFIYFRIRIVNSSNIPISDNHFFNF